MRATPHIASHARASALASILSSSSRSTLLVSSSLQARRINSVMMEVGEMDGEDLSTYIRKQDNLNAKGVTVLMAEALAHHSPGSEGDFSDTAAELMIRTSGCHDAPTTSRPVDL